MSGSDDPDRSIQYTSIFTLQTSSLSQKCFGFGNCRSVSDFEKLNRIGEGTYGVVYRARDLNSQEIVALKRVRIDEKSTSACGFSDAALREITILKRMRNVNIVQLKEIAVTRDYKGVFLVMEYCEQDLGALLDLLKIPFTVSEVKCIIQQLFSGLKYLHLNYIIHRDLKVSNLLLTKDGILKIADFGLARSIGHDQLKMTNRVVTLWYRPPELLLGGEYQTTGVDSWAAGCIFGELLLHRPLMPGKTEIDQIEKIIQLLGTPTAEIWPDFDNMPLVKNIHLRYQPYNNIKVVFTTASAAAVSLLKSLFAYDPNRRATAEFALQHPFFTEDPLPCLACDLPVLPPSHNSSHSRKRRHS